MWYYNLILVYFLIALIFWFKFLAPEGDSVDQIPPSDPNAHGVELLWQPDIVRPYLYLLGHCLKFPEILEAAAGALQNLTHGSWQVCGY